MTNYSSTNPQNKSTQPLQISDTKSSSLKLQIQIITDGLEILNLTKTTSSKASLIYDINGLLQMIGDIKPVTKNPFKQAKRTSFFTIHSKRSGITLAKDVTYEQAQQFHNVVIRFSHMECATINGCEL